MRRMDIGKFSAELCTFNTPWGRYKFLCLPFGIKSTSEVFQKNNEVFGDISGAHIIADDMIIAASMQEEHDQILKTVKERAQSENIKFNPDKIFIVSEVRYMGHLLSAEGIKPDDSKVQTITRMTSSPQDKRALQRLLGMG